MDDLVRVARSERDRREGCGRRGGAWSGGGPGSTEYNARRTARNLRAFDGRNRGYGSHVDVYPESDRNGLGREGSRTCDADTNGVSIETETPTGRAHLFGSGRKSHSLSRGCSPAVAFARLVAPKARQHYHGSQPLWCHSRRPGCRRQRHVGLCTRFPLQLTPSRPHDRGVERAAPSAPRRQKRVETPMNDHVSRRRSATRLLSPTTSSTSRREEDPEPSFSLCRRRQRRWSCAKRRILRRFLPGHVPRVRIGCVDGSLGDARVFPQRIGGGRTTAY